MNIVHLRQERCFIPLDRTHIQSHEDIAAALFDAIWTSTKTYAIITGRPRDHWEQLNFVAAYASHNMPAEQVRASNMDKI